MFILLLILFPILGSILNGLVLQSRVPQRAGALATAAALLSFITSIVLWFQLEQTGAPVVWSYEWFAFSDWRIDWSFAFDRLTAVMVTMVTGIGTLIHLYSIGYLSEEPTPYRYFAYLNLFLANMLILLTAGNLLVLFVGWEGVGLCSYLLIGYWYDDLKKSNAGMKAFLVNRIGDAGFIIGIFLCLQVFKTLEFSSILKAITLRSGGLSISDLRSLSLIAFFLFVGATGKSAQIPLYVWLPDAMAGPTPVSALIHAATMVTAGIYLIVRMSPLFEVAAQVNNLIAIIGISTALLSALIATSQKDIKKILAYSTVSQLGLMFVALGSRAYVAAIFHVLTHAFFKALLFLGAGSVIHGMHHEQNIWEMGGLKKKMPATFWTFAIATVAISGIPPLAGFFSKDMILFAALNRESGGMALWGLGLLVSLLTAFYMTRLLVVVFFGASRSDAASHAHESPRVMLLPLFVLAVGSVVAGFMGVPDAWGMIPNFLEHYLGYTPQVHHTHIPEAVAVAIAVVVGVVGMTAGYFFYSDTRRASQIAPALQPLRALCQNQFWIDDLYGLVFVRPFQIISGWLSRFFDRFVIDGLVLLPSYTSQLGSVMLSFVQFGGISGYLLWMLVGTLGILWFCVGGALR